MSDGHTGHEASLQGSQQPGQFLAGDALRGIASLGVIVCHVLGSTGSLGKPPGAFVQHGARWIGALDFSLFVFLVLSGYLLSRPFLAWILGQRSKPDLRRYAQNRLVRIVPPMWVAWTVVMITTGVHGGSLLDIAAVYAFLQNYVDQAVSVNILPAWTVGVEAIYYTLLPIVSIGIVWLIHRSRLPAAKTLLTLLGGAALASLAFRWHFRTAEGGRSFPGISYGFVPGILLAYVELRWAHRWKGARWGPGAAWGLLGLAAAIFAFQALYTPKTSNQFLILESADTLPATCVVAATLMLQWTTGRIWWLLGNRVSEWGGSRSYSIYLYHVLLIVPLVHIAVKQSTASAAFFVMLPLELIAVAIVAEISYRLVEKPSQALRSKKKPVAAASVVAPVVAEATT